MNYGPYFSSFQGGDYHVYPDGRVLMSGLHFLSDTVRGFTGAHCLIWFSNEGYLDTTAQHRTCAGSLDVFQQLPDGKFIGSGPTSTWDGQPASHIVQFHADGSLDTDFQANVWWGQAYGFLPLEDGRVYAVGQFKVQGLPDTLQLVRFMPDGSLDPTFNNTINFRITEMNNQQWGGLVRKIDRLDEGRLIVTGSFEEVEGQVRRCIAMVDTNGNLLNDAFVNAGVGNFAYQGTWGSALNGFLMAPDGNYYTWGAFHGYNDGTTNDTLQRFISRLHGLEVGVQEMEEEQLMLQIFPNPAQELVTFEFDPSHLGSDGSISVCDALGREVYRKRLSGHEHLVVWDTRMVTEGTYTATLRSQQGPVKNEKLIIQR